MGPGMILVAFLLISLVPVAESTASPRRLVIGVDGGTESIRACCFDAVTGEVVGKSCAVQYPTYHPQPGWAEQDPEDWYHNIGEVVREAVASIPADQENEFCSICVDTTCCSVVALDKDNKPLRRCLLWMDARSAPQSKQILETCEGDPALSVNCGGKGPLSAEWMTPKALWIRQNEPKVWKNAKTICEYQDFINYRLTGEICASSCNAASRWHWDGEECILDDPEGQSRGRPISLYQKLGIPELADKLPTRCLPMGAKVGTLTSAAAEHLGLPEDLPVTQGGADAFVGMIGLGCINPGQMCLITGSSHLHCVVSSDPSTSTGVWGAYKGAPLPGINFAEGGQSSTGSIIRWARNIFGASELSYQELDCEASAIPPGSDGLVALETFQGSRTPITDPMAKGALLGLTLSHTRAHIWRALMESVCFGTRACVEALEKAGHGCDEIVIAGGATRSNLWLQMHADVTGKPVVVCENADAPLLGCAILASVSSGVHNDVHDAVKSMVRIHKKIKPTKRASKIYGAIYNDVYSRVGDSARPVAHAIASLRGGSFEEAEQQHQEPRHQEDEMSAPSQSKARKTTISPSVLAADWSVMKEEVQRCVDAGLTRLHVDIFDGVFLDSPDAFTFGPQMVNAIRRCSAEVFLDLHMCVDRPARYVTAMKEAGANSFIFQWEAMDDVVDAIQLAKAIRASGMQCGVSINPSTPVREIYPLLKTELIAVVDVLAVEPGFGGQKFQAIAVDKVEDLLRLRSDNELAFEIMVDGGINEETVSRTAGADILVAGSYLFQHSESIRSGYRSLQLARIENISSR
eukprot:CAMPEP_0176044908 /NCGR_PEP_ID=MMETSP0120_2-20121206/22290_1 /TAXON_ID=160619 /ORGANISM="Kryptoperidinium foliaceum, Strain CCMP 1326" /LENGTH=805 /DNA_ID=CAMNT_0017378313 /DNA_START=309 /DNA_END=2726 /DNA_ORIENTATION=+